MSSPAAELGAAPPGVACAHCTLPVPAALVVAGTGRQFCCSGCGAAWTLLHESGLGRYYAFPERRDRPVTSSGRPYEEFDHRAFHELHARPRPGGLLEVELYLEGVHCASCVWLVERLPLAVPGTAAAELNVSRSLARVTWDPARTSLSAVARWLDRLGYRPHPFRSGHAERRRRAEDRAMLARIGVAGALAGNVMMLALALYAGWFGAMTPEEVDYFRWVSLALTAPALLWPGQVFFRSAWAAIRARRLHIDVPVAIALGAGFVRGTINTVTGTGPIYFDGVATLVFLLLVGRYLQQRAQRAAAGAAELLYGLTPATARLVGTGEPRDVPAEALVPGMEVEVRAGETIPADGVVTAGRSALDLSLLSGESRPVPAAPGDEVFAGTVNRSAALQVRVTRSGEASRLGRILADVEAGAARRAPIVHTTDRLAGAFVAVVLALAAITWLAWRGTAPDAALDNAIALLIVTCPCALALATPLSMTVAIGRAARRGILVRGADALEALARPGRLLLDKTGTLTEGRLALEHFAGDPRTRPAILALERHSSHPLAAAFQRAWPDIVPPAAAGVAETTGGGLEGSVGGRHLVVGAPAFVTERAADPGGLAAGIPAHLTPVLVAVDGTVAAAAGFGDPLRPDTRATLDALRARGWEPRILSGDAPDVVAHVAARLDLPRGDARGGATPEEKLAVVEQALATGPVVMVGDGVNDAAAIARATVGVGVHGGAEASLAAADVYLARPGLAPLAELVQGAGRTLRVIRRNIAVSLAYNVVGASLAMTGIMDPLIAAVVMPVSSLTVVLVAWRSRTFEIPA
jgi:P-type Cu2+ transporter